jgi:hypothetical protein
LAVNEPSNAAAEADAADPHRVVYWSAVYIHREAQRLEREYTRQLIQLRLWRMLRIPERIGA